MLTQNNDSRHMLAQTSKASGTHENGKLYQTTGCATDRRRSAAQQANIDPGSISSLARGLADCYPCAALFWRFFLFYIFKK
jgi:hypothetical protein